MKKIAFYGKGGIGKSTITANLAAALSCNGIKVMQIGCDPKADSTINLLGGNTIPTILDVLREKKKDLRLDDVIFKGFNGILCAESGGPTPGNGCAGRGIITAFETLESLKAFETYKPDYILYDVLGDVVCGGFAMPLRKGYAKEVCVVTSGEKMSLFAAENIAKAVKQFSGRSYARLRGLILNSRQIENEKTIVNKIANNMETKIILTIPRDTSIQQCENKGMTVIEGAPDSPAADAFKSFASKLISEKDI